VETGIRLYTEIGPKYRILNTACQKWSFEVTTFKSVRINRTDRETDKWEGTQTDRQMQPNTLPATPAGDDKNRLSKLKNYRSLKLQCWHHKCSGHGQRYSRSATVTETGILWTHSKMKPEKYPYILLYGYISGNQIQGRLRKSGSTISRRIVTIWRWHSLMLQDLLKSETNG